MLYFIKFFKDFDVFAAAATLRAREGTETKSFCTGVLSFLLAILFSYVFISESVKVLNYSSIDSNQVVGRFQKNKGEEGRLLLAFSIQEADIENITKHFTIKMQRQVFVEAPEKGKSKYNIEVEKEIGLKKCTAENFEIFSNKESLVNTFNPEIMFCPSAPEELVMKGEYFEDIFKQITLSISPCVNQSIFNEPCYSESQRQKFWTEKKNNSFAQMWLYFLDTELDTQAKDPFKIYIRSGNRILFSKNTAANAQAFFGFYEVETDFGIFPWQEKKVEKSQYFDIFYKENYFRDQNIDKAYAKVTFLMNGEKISVQRVVGKVEEMLSYAGGLFSIIIAFLAFFMMSFNEYKYELMVAEGAFNQNEQGRKILKQDLTFPKYIKYSVYDWVNVLCCFELQWEDCREIDEAREEANCVMDVTRVFRKLRTFQVCLLHLIPLNQMVTLGLTEADSIAETRKKRLFTDYYDAVMQGKEALTLEDIQLRYTGNIDMNPENRLMQMVEESLERLKILDIAFEKHPEIGEDAFQVTLSQQLQAIENEIAESFFSCDERVRRKIQEKIPVKILFRLKKKKQEGQRNTSAKNSSSELGNSEARINTPDVQL